MHSLALSCLFLRKKRDSVQLTSEWTRYYRDSCSTDKAGPCQVLSPSLRLPFVDEAKVYLNQSQRKPRYLLLPPSTRCKSKAQCPSQSRVLRQMEQSAMCQTAFHRHLAQRQRRFSLLDWGWWGSVSMDARTDTLLFILFPSSVYRETSQLR